MSLPPPITEGSRSRSSHRAPTFVPATEGSRTAAEEQERFDSSSPGCAEQGQGQLWPVGGSSRYSVLVSASGLSGRSIGVGPQEYWSGGMVGLVVIVPGPECHTAPEPGAAGGAGRGRLPLWRGSASQATALTPAAIVAATVIRATRRLPVPGVCKVAVITV